VVAFDLCSSRWLVAQLCGFWVGTSSCLLELEHFPPGGWSCPPPPYLLLKMVYFGLFRVDVRVPSRVSRAGPNLRTILPHHHPTPPPQPPTPPLSKGNLPSSPSPYSLHQLAFYKTDPDSTLHTALPAKHYPTSPRAQKIKTNPYAPSYPHCHENAQPGHPPPHPHC